MADSYVSVEITVTFSTLSAKLLDLSTTGHTAETVDVTHQASTDQWREHLEALKDGGEVTWTVHVGGTVPEVATNAELVVTLPTGAGTLTVMAILTKRKGLSATLGDKIVEELTWKLTGKPAWT